MWKLLTEVIAKDMYNDLEQKKLLPEEQEGSLGEKCPNTDFFSGPYFPVFELNMEIYSENLCIQSEYRKIRTRKNSVFGHFLCSGCRQGSRGTKDQLLFDKTVLKDFKKRHINLSMTWIDYKKRMTLFCIAGSMSV